MIRKTSVLTSFVCAVTIDKTILGIKAEMYSYVLFDMCKKYALSLALIEDSEHKMLLHICQNKLYPTLQSHQTTYVS